LGMGRIVEGPNRFPDPMWVAIFVGVSGVGRIPFSLWAAAAPEAAPAGPIKPSTASELSHERAQR
jgi:hypothetical protein